MSITGSLHCASGERRSSFITYHKHIDSFSLVFDLCCRIGGGVITLAGVDQRIHLPSSVYGIQYAKLARGGNWYTLNLQDLFLEDQVTGTQRSIAKPPMGAAIFNMGKGVIIDSGTTATYLPAFLLTEFKAAFKAITDFDYTGEAPATLTQAQLKRCYPYRFSDMTYLVNILENL